MFARRLVEKAAAQGMQLTVSDLAVFEVEQLWKERLVVIVTSTYEDGTPPQNARWFCQWLEESSTDFRVGAQALKDTSFAVFGCGNSLYEANFNKVAKTVDAQLGALGGQRLVPLGQGDEDSGKLEEQFEAWSGAVLQALKDGPSEEGAAQIEGDARSDGYCSTDSDDEREQDSGEVGDLEDLGGPASRNANGGRTADGAPSTSGREAATTGADANAGPKEMLSPPLRAALGKQGYKLVGSHSGVKLCRWTKSMLRGRGGCYKHAFYGIESHRCMEATPSLACANKCVFCWRHHTNPVGREWRWKMDAPEEIVEGALSHHVRMINEFKGVPGVKPDRLAEGMQVRHCALSLVGEPIMYPEINHLISLLHARRISSFLVTNAQFPDRIRQLQPVTQLYVSVDAATRDGLKAIDRPLFKDFWQRFLDCLTELRDKRQRTVYRLTLVKGWNTEEVADYARLVGMGAPDFVEIKGVTYCGSSGASSLTMQNVPYHEDVCAFGEALCEACDGEYGLACEHAHSCCILLARKSRFHINGRWHTWIDYNRFQELAAGSLAFSSQDYMLPTPEWAVYGSPEAGFNPQETRVKKARNHPAKAESGGCT
ncbi:S-adenosyl-L-methionine-dependent tRNA 4-demethylwyosine synthase [Coccomyxa sp. Obi]|nr:S-adenosyl-L-methionine-dependent tRNA 4-demethylwyosine synthase [Coccomyxa sp. Obi]